MGNNNSMAGQPALIKDPIYQFDTFQNGEVLHNKKKKHLPAMGWNSWNAFGSGNTEYLTKAMADAIVALGLDSLGYHYVVLDDGCYKPERVNGKLSNETEKFPSGFKALADYIHERGLKFGMYNDIGTNLCAGAAVGTCGHEVMDAQTYLDWDVDFLKVDNCYYLWDNATFSNPENAKYVYAPNIQAICVSKEAYSHKFCAVKDGIITGIRGHKLETYVTNIGTFDGTGPENSPLGAQSSELCFLIDAPENGIYDLKISYATGKEEGVGSWLQLAVLDGDCIECGADGVNFLKLGENGCKLLYDDFLPETENVDHFILSPGMEIPLKKGINTLRLMNHRRQENTLGAYGTLVKAFQTIGSGKDIILSICEWGKTQPQNWGYKVGDSWRILNDITFQVGTDGDPGVGHWMADYTTSVVAQYNKAVIMDEFSGLEKGWNDPDMLMIGMNGLSMVMNKTHMTMWCMLNAPLMLGLDLRRVKKGDEIWNIIANEKIIALNQDSLGIQAKRIYSTKQIKAADQEYIVDADRVDVLAKPLIDGSIAISFINVSEHEMVNGISITVDQILEKLRDKMVLPDLFENAETYNIEDLWTGDIYSTRDKEIQVMKLLPCDNITMKVTPIG